MQQLPRTIADAMFPDQDTHSERDYMFQLELLGCIDDMQKWYTFDLMMHLKSIYP